MANIYPAPFRITPTDHGNFIVIGNAAERRTGTIIVQFVPDPSFDGALSPVGRIATKQASDNAVPFVGVPFRQVYLNSAVADYSMVAPATAAEITSGSIIQIPANGLTIAFLVACNAGFGNLYFLELDGPGAV